MVQCETAVHEPPLPFGSDPLLGKPPAPQIVRVRLGTIGALVLALGATLPLDTPKPTTEPSDHPSSQKNTLSVPQKTHSGIPEEMIVEDFRTEDATFTCRFGKRTIAGSIDDGGNISTVRFDDLTIALTSPISERTLERFLRSATGTAALLTARGATPDGHTLTATGSARFQFTKTHGEKSSLWIATSRDLLMLDPAYEKEREEAAKKWKALLTTIDERRTNQVAMIDQRMGVHNTRMHATYDDLTSRSERHYPRSYERYYWNERRNEFIYGWNAISEKWDGASSTERRALLSDFHAHLASWEEWLSLHPDMETEDAFSSRYQKILDEIRTLQREANAIHNRTYTRLLHDPINKITITEQSSPLSPKNFTREYKSVAGLLLRHQTYEDDVLTKETEYDPSGNIAKDTISQYFPGGQIRRAQEHTPKNGKMALQRQTDYWRNGNTHAVLDKRSDAFAYFGESGSLLYEDVARSTRERRQRGMVDAKGERFGLYADEKAKNKDLTPSQYLDILAKKLDTEERLAVYFEQFLWYAFDDGDHWQTAEETLRRTEEYENGGARYMRGDCDDYAFLARDILRRQGKNAHVVYIPGHAICVWAEKDAEGEYHARAEDTFGFDHNGNRYGRDFPHDRERAKGFTELIDALNSIIKKYRYPGLGLREGQDYTFDPNAIWILPNPPSGTYQSVTADYFLQNTSS